MSAFILHILSLKIQYGQLSKICIKCIQYHECLTKSFSVGGKSRINHSTAKSSSFSPFLGRKSRLFGAFPSTPNSTPFSTPFVKRRQLGAAGAGGGVDADHSSVARLNSFLPQHNQVSISPTLYKQLFCTKVFFETFFSYSLALQF